MKLSKSFTPQKSGYRHKNVQNMYNYFYNKIMYYCCFVVLLCEILKTKLIKKIEYLREIGCPTEAP